MGYRMKIRILKTRKRVPISANIINLTDEAQRWAKLEKKLLKRIYNNI